MRSSSNPRPVNQRIIARDPARKPSVLVIEDDPDIVEVVRFNLEREGFRVHDARDGERGLDQARRSAPDLILLDLMLPGIDGLEVCRRLRTSDETRAVPVVVLTAKSEEADVVVGLEMGADDYLTKPFSPRELVARARAVLRRVSRAEERGGRTRIELHDLVLDSTRFEALNRGEIVPLTRAEFRLLWALAQRPGRVYSRGELADEITAGESLIIDRNVDVHVSSIRRKLGEAGKVIATVRGVGYKCID
jgi:two-component system alkaline phosphatase synthesis response regulator PhoP